MTFFDHAYEGTPTWDIGRPQATVVRLAEAGLIAGAVLDAGCGTGEHALYLAGLGHRVVGIDLAAAAIKKARAKAAERGTAATFLLGDVLDAGDLGQAFDTVLDVGLFHCLEPGQRRSYAEAIRAALRPGGTCFLLCWSSRNPFGYGPTRIRRGDIRTAFTRGWRIEAIEADELETRLPPGRVHAWLARLRRS